MGAILQRIFPTPIHTDRGCFFFQAEDGIRDHCVTGVQTCALPIYSVAFSLGPTAPVGAGITSAGLFTWTPTPAQAGVLYNLKIIVSDNSVPPFTDSRTVAINVLPNLAPVLVSTTVNNGSAQRSRVTSL